MQWIIVEKALRIAAGLFGPLGIRLFFLAALFGSLAVTFDRLGKQDSKVVEVLSYGFVALSFLSGLLCLGVVAYVGRSLWKDQHRP